MNVDKYKTELIEFLRDLVRIPSINPPGDTDLAAELLIDRMKKHGIDAELCASADKAGNVVGKASGNRKGKVLLLNGHLDIVPPGDGWSFDPFSAEIVDDRLYGRGTVDMKSGLCALLFALACFKELQPGFAGEIIFSAVCDEETGSRNGTRYLIEQGIFNNVDVAIVAEPTHLKVMPGNRGLRWIDVIVSGRAAHAGRPHVGINAIHYASMLVNEIQSMVFQSHDENFEIPTPSITVNEIKGGSKINIVPESCHISIDRRMIPGETGEIVENEIKEVIRGISEREEGLIIDLKFREAFWDPFVISTDSKIVCDAANAVERVTGKAAQIMCKGACTDASHLYHQGGIPTILLGPGNEQYAHKKDEHIVIEEIYQAFDIYIDLFEKTLGV